MEVAVEVTDSGDGSALGAMNNFTGVFLALALIAVSIGIITTIVGVVAYKSGVIQQSKFEPWKILAGLWGAVLLISMPSLIYYGSTLMPPPAATNAQTVTPAYENFDKTEIINKADTWGPEAKEQIKAALGSQASNYGRALNSDDVTLKFWPSADDPQKPDACYEMVLSWADTVGGGNGIITTDEATITPDGYSEEACGGPLKSLGG